MERRVNPRLFFMPAVEIVKLRARVNLLKGSVTSPDVLVKELTALYETYADRTFQSSQTDFINAQSAYRTPDVLNREIENGLNPLLSEKPEFSLQVIEMLWDTQVKEPRFLAAMLLGKMSGEYFEKVFGLIRKWSTSGENFTTLSNLLLTASHHIRKEKPELWLGLLAEWENSADKQHKKMAILGTIPLIRDEAFENLPIIFRLLDPLLRNPDTALLVPLEKAIEELILRSEIETVHFLKQVNRSSNNADLPRFIRRLLPSFSQSNQESIKSALREK